MNESRNRFIFPAFAILFVIALFRSMSKGKLSGFLLEQGLILLLVGAVVAVFVWVDGFLRKGHSAEWMTRYYKWVFGGIGAAGVTFLATVFMRFGLDAKREGELGVAALTLVSMTLVTGTIVSLAKFFRKRRSEQWLNGFRIWMALVVVALLTGLGAYLLSQKP